MLLKYAPKRIVGSYQPNLVGAPSISFLGFMDDSFIEAEFSEAAVTKHVGAHGDVTYVLNADKTAMLKIQIVQGSVTNDLLSRYIPDARRNYMPTGTLSFRDLNGNTVVSDHKSVIEKAPKVVFGKSINGREWAFIMGDAEIVAGGDNS